MIPAWKPVTTFDAIARDAVAECGAAQFNLLLPYELPITVLGSAFVNAHRSQATKWMADPPPRELVFSHGQFFRGKRGMDHVVEELERKSLSRRAMLAMIDMDTLLASADRSVPAFSLLQFAIDGRVLYVTAYFRALEVGAFLLTNLAEIALHCENIHKRFGTLQTIRLLILAFRAYHQPDFHCLEKLPIDSEPSGTIAVAVAEHQYDKLRTWLNDKYRVESVVQLQGMEEMLTAVRASSKPYPRAFTQALERAVQSLGAFKHHRTQLNEGEQVDRARREFEDDLGAALAALPK
jgi:hypothetical protein